ncbi:hypothetical protein P7K49_014317 [Saguinus oedipus]|uniref:Uncharacterized protein n=1 Tax=Saguinus oedipus TaxID=9490 RepID=A0ABQ9VIU1_SAGOE|nr:hypothetical protein P7K49_014317 [Saguinus oedipus]
MGVLDKPLVPEPRDKHLDSMRCACLKYWLQEALSRMEQDEVFCKGMTRSVSADDLTSLRHAKAVLS